MAKYVYDRFREKEINAFNITLFNSCINFTNVLLCNYCTKIFIIVVNTCVCRRSVDNKALILSYPILLQKIISYFRKVQLKIDHIRVNPASFDIAAILPWEKHLLTAPPQIISTSCNFEPHQRRCVSVG